MLRWLGSAVGLPIAGGRGGGDEAKAAAHRGDHQGGGGGGGGGDGGRSRKRGRSPPGAASGAPAAAAAPPRALRMASHRNVVVRYKKYADPKALDHSVKVLYPANGSCGTTKWYQFLGDKFAAAQTRIPEGEMHPATSAVLAVMRAVPDGHEVHPDRGLMVTGTTMAGLLGRNHWLKRDAAAEGLASVEELLLARAQGRVPAVQQNAHMLRGKHEEAEALDLLQKVTGIELVRDRRMGYLTHPSKVLGASPDGICKRIPCLVEIKSKKWKVDLAVPDEHYDQMQTQMLATERVPGEGPLIRAVLYVQYVSRGEKGFPVISIRVVRFNDAMRDEMLAKAHAFCVKLHGGSGGGGGGTMDGGGGGRGGRQPRGRGAAAAGAGVRGRGRFVAPPRRRRIVSKMRVRKI